MRSRAAAGFTLFEALVSVALMAAVVASLGAVSGQWLPNWHRGFGRVQRLQALDVGLRRLTADLEAADYVTPNSVAKEPVFIGNEKSVTLVRDAIGPGAASHLEFVTLAETVDERGFALVRSRAPFKPLDPNRPIDAQLYFADPVVLVRAPYRVSFAFAGADRIWQPSWSDPVLLPTATRIEVRDAVSETLLAFSTVTLLNASLPAECVTQKSAQECIDAMRARASAPASTQTVGPANRP